MVRFKFSDGRMVTRDWMGLEQMRSMAASFLKQRWKRSQFTGLCEAFASNATIDRGFGYLVSVRIEEDGGVHYLQSGLGSASWLKTRRCLCT